MNTIIEFVLNQSPIFIVSVLALVVAGLALVFGVSVIYFIHKKESKC